MNITNEIYRLISDRKINDAENELFFSLETECSPDLLNAAIFFYNTLQSMSDIELDEMNFTREEIDEGKRDFFSSYDQKVSEAMADTSMLHPRSENQESTDQSPKHDFAIESFLKPIFLSSKPLHVLYLIFLITSGITGLFLTSRLYETIICLLLIVLYFTLNLIFKSATAKNITNSIFGIVFGAMFISVILTQNPFFNMLLSNKNDKYFDNFSQGLFYYAAGDYDKAISQFQKSKKYVIDEYKSNWYVWYLEVLSRSNRYAEMHEAIDEYMRDLASGKTDAEELRMVSLVQSVLLFNTFEHDKLIQYSENMFQATNERFYLEILILLYSLNITTDEVFSEKLLNAFDVYKDSTDSFQEYIELRQLFWELTTDILLHDNNTLWVVADSLGYHVSSFNYYINQYALMGGIGNIQLTDLQRLKAKKRAFDTALLTVQAQYADIYDSFEDELIEYGAHLGSLVVVRLLYDKKEYGSNFDEISSAITDSDTVIYFSFIQTGNRITYLKANKEENLSSIEEGRYISIEINLMSLQPANNVIVCHNEKEPLLLNTYVQLLPFNDHSIIIARRIGTAEMLDLAYLNLSTNEMQDIPINGFSNNYHIKNFDYNSSDNTFAMGFEIEEFMSANISQKVLGEFYGSIDPNTLDINYTIGYPNPALEFYQLKRNEDLVLPLVVLNEVNGKEILDEDLKSLISKNIQPIYRHSNIDNTYANLVFMPGGELSGIIIDYYDSDSNNVTSNQPCSFFFIVSKEGENIELKRIYKILDDGVIKSVYEQTFYRKLINWVSDNVKF